MSTENQIVFAPFRLDTRNERLYRDGEVIDLRPKSLAVLRYLAERPDRLVIKEELLGAVWPETSVSDTVLKVCVREIRHALGDNQKPWQFIETAHRRGYRFIGKPAEAEAGSVIAGNQTRARRIDLVGRAAEVAQLEGSLAKALAGERQMVFVTGEPGMGKTAVVDAFLERAAADASIWVGLGQCLEQYGAGEGYMPVLDALSRLCRSSGGERMIALLRRYAPMWLAQMPGLISADERERLQREITGATRERMLREMSQAMEMLSAEAPLVLVLEDLHWSDYSTVDLLASLAGQRRPARLMIIGTYRPAEVLATGHPLNAMKQELQMHRRCRELSIAFLDERAVTQFLEQRFQGAPFASELASWIHRRTDGNPLFMVNMVDYLVDRGLIAHVDGDWRLTRGIEQLEPRMPENILQMIEKQIDRLGAEQQRVLEAASVAGTEFSVTAVAAGLEQDEISAEETCETLARRHQFVQGGSAMGRYRFIHALYQNALQDRIPAGRRARLHQRVGEYEEQAYGDRAHEIAAELAMHFEQARDHRRAVHHLRQAAENASRRFAHGEAVALARRGLALLDSLPDTPERTQQELMLQATLAIPLSATEGYGSAEVENTYSRARALCQQLGDALQLFPILVGLSKFYVIRAELKTALEFGEQLLRIAERDSGPVLLLEAHWTLGITFVNLGQFAQAHQHLEQAVALYRPQDLDTYLKGYGHDPRSVCRCFWAWALWSLGDTERALDEAHAALAIARETRHPETLGFALFFNGWLHQLRRDSASALEHTTALLEHAGRHGLVQWRAFGMSLHGWALAMQGRREEGVEQMRQALAVHRAIGSEISRPHFLALLAEALADGGEVEEGLSALAEAMAAAEKTSGRYYEAELYRLEGELLLRSSTENRGEAEACFRRAIDIARQQQAKGFERLAQTSLSQLTES